MADHLSIHKFKAGDIFHERYTLEKLIGVGGFADVWKAEDTITHTSIALKIYTNLDDDGINDLSEEYSRMQSLSHTNILKADHFDRWGTIPYLTMKLCSGGSLDKKVGKLDDEELLHVIKDMAEGLKYLHQNKIVHQDIKPANILIDEHNGVTNYVLSDFGISSKTKTKLSHSVNMKNLGTSMTEDYAPPEKFSSNKEDRRPDRKGDIFSFGISIYELASGGLPFDDMPTGRQLQYGDVEIDFSEIKNDKIRHIVSECMQPDKDDRPNADEILEMLASDKFSDDNDDGFDNDNDNDNGFDNDDDNNIPDDNGGELGHGKKTVKMQETRKNKSWGIIVAVALGVFALIAAGTYFFLIHKKPTQGPKPDPIPQLTRDTFTINGVSFVMVNIPGGDFELGCSDANDKEADANEKPSQKRHVSDFSIGTHEVTQQLWFVVMNENPSKTVNDKFPVTNVSWDDCQLFISRLNAITGRNFRLPTEVEWEYAAKGDPNSPGTAFKYSGTDNDLSKYAWIASNSNGSPHPVGTKKPNAYGLYDMSGNAIEWCQDIYTNYSTGYPEIDKDQRVLRGGYYDGEASSARCTNRGSCDYKTRMPFFGFRLCLQ